jgi:hypothetical protein
VSVSAQWDGNESANTNTLGRGGGDKSDLEGRCTASRVRMHLSSHEGHRGAQVWSASPLELISIRQTVGLDLGTTTLLDRGPTAGTQESVHFPPLPSSSSLTSCPYSFCPSLSGHSSSRRRPRNHIRILLIHQGRTVTAYPLVPLPTWGTLLRRCLVHPRQTPLLMPSSCQLEFTRVTLAVAGVDKGLDLALRPITEFRNLPISGGDDSKEPRICIERVALVSM